MPTPHIAASPGDVAETVLLPGDPRRAELIAERFLESPVEFNRVRGMLGFTGTCRGRPLSVMGHGMGMPSIGIYAHELIAEFGVRTLIRVGSCGSIQESVRLRDVILAQTASTDSGWQAQYGITGHFAPCADFELLAGAAAGAAARPGLRCHVGGVLSTDIFYSEDAKAYAPWARLGVLAAEMETAALYMIAARRGVRALAVLTVSDEVCRPGAQLSAAEREQTFEDMVEVALAAVAATASAPPEVLRPAAAVTRS